MYRVGLGTMLRSVPGLPDLGGNLQVLSAASGKLVWSVTLPGPTLAAQLAEDTAEPTLLLLTRENGWGPSEPPLSSWWATGVCCLHMQGLRMDSLSAKLAYLLAIRFQLNAWKSHSPFS